MCVYVCDSMCMCVCVCVCVGGGCVSLMYVHVCSYGYARMSNLLSSLGLAWKLTSDFTLAFEITERCLVNTFLVLFVILTCLATLLAIHGEHALSSCHHILKSAGV